MSDLAYLGSSAVSVEKSPEITNYTKVIIHVDDDTTITAGQETVNGRTLELDCPWGTQAMANNILAHLNNFVYRPYTAEGALLGPAEEIGDAITVTGILSAIYSQRTSVKDLYASSVSAPCDEEIEHEFKFVSQRERKFNRELKNQKTEFTIAMDEVRSEVQYKSSTYAQANTPSHPNAGDMWYYTGTTTAQRRNGKWYRYDGQNWIELTDAEVGGYQQVFRQSTPPADPQEGFLWYYTGTTTSQYTNGRFYMYHNGSWILAEDATYAATISQHSTDIAAKVSKTGGTSSSFSWNLNDSSFTLKDKSNRSVFLANADGVTIDGTVRATAGTIGGWDIGSYSINNGLAFNDGKNTNATGLGTNTSDGDWAFWAGNGRFSVKQDGTVYASNITISGGSLNINDKFIVDSEGNMTARGGTFQGTVYAQCIIGGDQYQSYMDGGIIENGTISSAQLGSSVRSSLSNADLAYQVYMGQAAASTIRANGLRVDGTLTCDHLSVGSLTWGNYNLANQQITIVTNISGETVNRESIHYIEWY